MAVTPTKSASDDRGYKIITLPNKLTAILVSDPTTDKVRRKTTIYTSLNLRV